MDLGMPEMDGREALRSIRNIEQQHGIYPHHGAKVVIVTAADEIRSVMDCFGDLCDDYLVKPVSFDDLLKDDLLKKVSPLHLVPETVA
jgi:two-component system chemotaxis response regulator CheY